MSERAYHENPEVEIPEPVRPPFGDNLRIDSEDDDNLDRLPEIERELILSERHEVLMRYREEKALYDKFMRKNAPASPIRSPEPRGIRGGRPHGHRARSDDSDSYSSDSSSDSSRSGSSYSSSSDNEDRAVRKLAKAATERDIADSMDAKLSVDTACKMQVSRDELLSAFQDVPVELRDETLTDLFVRLPSGTGEYLISRILGAPAASTKTVESGKFDLVIELSQDEQATVPVSSVSNSWIQDSEVSAWVELFGTEAAKQQARKVGKKQSQIKQIKQFVWDDKTINRILSTKGSSVKLTLEIAKLRTQLQAELGALNTSSSSLSDSQRDTIQANVNRINREITELENQSRFSQRAFADANAHQFGIVAINHRNKTEQRMQDVEEARKRLRTTKVSKADVAKELNPFKRRECKPVVMWDVGKRSPKKEPSADPALADTAQPDLLTAAPHKVSIADLVSLDSLVSDVTHATSQPGNRLAGVRRSQRVQYGDTISKIWKRQLESIQPGEIMDFTEWKRRVADDVEMV